MERFIWHASAPRLWPLAALTLMLTACGEEEETESTAVLRISGSPDAFLAVSERYLFAPTAVDPEGDPLTFSVSGKPSWLAFDQTTGVLTGTPTTADIGLYRSITIEVSDGRTSERLAPFDLEVVAIGSHTATIAWQTPTENEDGSPLTDLAGFQIRYGRQPGTYSHRVDVPNQGVATYVISGLVPGSYYFAMTAYTRTNVGSAPSPEMTIAIR